MKKWQCVVCGFVYDEAMGWPAEGIAAGTSWAAIPDDWECRIAAWPRPILKWSNWWLDVKERAGKEVGPSREGAE